MTPPVPAAVQADTLARLHIWRERRQAVILAHNYQAEAVQEKANQAQIDKENGWLAEHAKTILTKRVS